jgi:hypothetical protein
MIVGDSMKVLLTVPHGGKDNDELAPVIAAKISRFLDLMDVSNVRKINYYPRSMIDMNRPASRGTDFRNEIEAKLKELTKNDVLIDVHSFPDDDQTPYELYFLDIYGIDQDDSFNRALHSFLVKHGVNAAILAGSQINDIVMQAMEYGMENLTLAEFNRSLSPDRFNVITKLVASFVAAMPTRIVAQTNGVITEIDNGKITVYIDIKDNHDIFAPVTGKIEHLIAEKGDFDRYLKLFQSWEKKRGRLTIGIENIRFLIEVGEGYVTNKIKVKKLVGEGVKRGEIIGHIVLGSLSEIYIPKEHSILVTEGQRLVGGKTILAMKAKQAS